MLEEITSAQLVEWEAYLSLRAYEAEHGQLPPFDPEGGPDGVDGDGS
jgi:hypothetical protein